MLLSNNSLAVYLDDTRIGYLQLNRETRDWDPGYIQTQAVNHRAAIIDANILVNEQVSLKHVRANRRYHETITVIIREVSQNFTYQILATAIYVDNERIAVMRTQSLANHVANHFIGAHRNTNTTEAYIEGWELKTLTVKDENLDSTDTAIQRLDRSVETIIPYVVQSGDTKGAIALRHGIPFDRLLADNDLKADAIIRPGDIINIRSTRPFLTVRTIQEETRTESIPKEVIRNYNDQLAMGDIKILQEGRDGERTVVVRKTFINGQFSTEEIISTVITTQPETRVVEEGTSEAAAPEWRP
jgi:LysM repeat protein